MKTFPKLLLTVSVTAFVVGFATVRSDNLAPAWAVAMPLGAVSLGLFLIAFMLQNEVAQFDEENRLRLELTKSDAPVVFPVADTRSEAVPAAGAFTATNSR